jgi:hypothetical protein
MNSLAGVGWAEAAAKAGDAVRDVATAVATCAAGRLAAPALGAGACADGAACAPLTWTWSASAGAAALGVKGERVALPGAARRELMDCMVPLS